MPDVVYTINTDLNPQQLTDVAIETYKMWVEFSEGRRPLGGQKVRHATGKMASEIQWKQTGVATVSIFTNSKTAHIFELGYKAYDLKRIMLNQKSRMSKKPDPATGQRYRYRFIPNFEGRFWFHEGGFLTMSEKKGSSPWKVPASGGVPWPRAREHNGEFMPYCPAKILADLIRQKYVR